ncbi:hypothetical protein MD484_g1616, partial [Candolleomyces efflorescens]
MDPIHTDRVGAIVAAAERDPSLRLVETMFFFEVDLDIFVLALVKIHDQPDLGTGRRRYEIVNSVFRAAGGEAVEEMDKDEWVMISTQDPDPLSPNLPTPRSPLGLLETVSTPLASPLSATKEPKNNLVEDILKHEHGGLTLFSDPVFRESQGDEMSPPPLNLPPVSSSSRTATPTPSAAIDFHVTPPSATIPPDPSSHPTLQIGTVSNTLPHPLASASPSPGQHSPSTRPRTPPQITTPQATKAAKSIEDEAAIIAKHLGLIDHDYFFGREPAEASEILIPETSKSRERSRSKLGQALGGRATHHHGPPHSRHHEGLVGVAPPITSSGEEWDGVLGRDESAERRNDGRKMGLPNPPPLDLDATNTTSSIAVPTSSAHARRGSSYSSLNGLWGLWRGNTASSDEVIVDDPSNDHPPAGSSSSNGHHDYATVLSTSPPPIQPTIVEGRPLDTSTPEFEQHHHQHAPMVSGQIAGAPGFKPNEYDWDKGFSEELERELQGVQGRQREPSKTPKSAGARQVQSTKELEHHGEYSGERGRQAKRESLKRDVLKKEAADHHGHPNGSPTTPSLYQTIGSKFGFGSWGAPSSSSSSASSSPATTSRNSVVTPPAGASSYSDHYTRAGQIGRSGHTRSATTPTSSAPHGTDSEKEAMGDLIEKRVGGVELKARKESTVGVLTQHITDLIRPHLPPLSRLPRSWSLLYSLDQHGISLNTLYTNCEAPEKQRKTGHQPYIGMRGAVVVLRDAEADLEQHVAGKSVFGAFIAEGLGRKVKGFYGGGDSFLWKYDAASDEVKVFKPTGKNTYFAICDTDYIGFGGGYTWNVHPIQHCFKFKRKFADR